MLGIIFAPAVLARLAQRGRICPQDLGNEEASWTLEAFFVLMRRSDGWIRFVEWVVDQTNTAVEVFGNELLA
jgi:hypothetical protein